MLKYIVLIVLFLISIQSGSIAGQAFEKDIVKIPEPRVRFRTFGDSGLLFELLCWIPQPVLRGRIIDSVNESVYKAFIDSGIEIPFPKRDIYVKQLPEKSE